MSCFGIALYITQCRRSSYNKKGKKVGPNSSHPNPDRSAETQSTSQIDTENNSETRPIVITEDMAVEK